MVHESETRRGAHPCLRWAIAAFTIVAAIVLWFSITISRDNAYKAEAQRACVDDVTAKYHDREATVFATLEGRDGDRLEFKAFDTLAEFHWTCFVTKRDGVLVVDSFK